MNSEKVYERAWGCYLHEQYEEALRILEQGLKIDSLDYDLLRLKAGALNALDRNDEELAVYEQMIQNYPDRAGGYWGKAETTHVLDGPILALPLYKKALTFLRDDEKDLGPILFLGYADALKAAGKRDQAISLIDDGLKHPAVGDRALLESCRKRLVDGEE